MTDPTPIAGLLLGLAGSVHCVAMCGGVASALDRIGPQDGHRLRMHLLYALGRVGTYTAIGAVVGFAGASIVQLVTPAHMPKVQLATRYGLGLILIAFGAGLAGFPFLRGVERLGHGIWKRLQPMARPLMGLPTPLRTLGLGALWGFIPCGMVYGALAVASVTGSVANAAIFMAAFGLGTVPAVLSTGAVAAGFWKRIGRENLRRVSAIAVALCGVWVIVGPMLLKTSEHAHHH